MRSFRKKRPPLILLAFVLAIVALMTLESRAGLRRQPLFGLFSPVFSALHAVSDGVSGLWEDYLALVGTEEENRRLRLENERLRRKNARVVELEGENRRLRTMLGLRERMDPRAVVAEVTARSPVSSLAALTINRGRRDGVLPDLPVVGTEGLIGRVFAVSPGSAKVLLITDPKSAVAVRFQDTREEAILDGAGGLCALRYVHKDAPVSPGDVVVTSGLDGIYPPGLRVGVVTTVRKLDYGIFQEVEMLPYEAFDRIEYVLVLRRSGDDEGGGGAGP